MNINNYMTVTEAAYRWGKNPRAVRERLNLKRRSELQDELNSGLVKYFKAPTAKEGVWIITAEVMVSWYGEEPKKMEDDEMNKEVEIIEVEGTKFYAFDANVFENEADAEGAGYYWNDEIGKWVKVIADNTTTIF